MKRPAVLALALAVVVAVAVVIVAIFRPPATDAPPGEETAAISFDEGRELVWREQPAPVPATPFTSGGGEEVSLRDFEGRVVLLNFWATWCAPCVHEMPALDRLQAELGGERFEVVALSSDRGGVEAVEPFYEELGLNSLAVYLDPMSAVGRAFEIRGLPTTVLIDSQGREMARKEGPAEWDSPAIQNIVRSMTGQ